MPKRTDIKTILIIGAGPITIGQGCEFDYSGTQACKALVEDDYRVVLINSNPATIMTDIGIAHATYIEPITLEFIEKIIIKEKPDAILPTMGGQTALNMAIELYEAGLLDKYGIEMIGASYSAIKKAEDRELFKSLVKKLGFEVPKSVTAENIKQAQLALKEIGLPCIIRSSFSLGGDKSGIAYTEKEFLKICSQNFALNIDQKLIIDESIIGWKEFEMEVVRDIVDNCIIVCTIENINPVGVHTGDSITVAPAQTLTDKEYQYLRKAAFCIIREIGINTGGSNVQFAVNPRNGQVLVIEINPRVSRSSALASKATGVPIAKLAAKLAVGYTLDELQNQITNPAIPYSFEPTLDYVVTKIPRFNFDKFPNTSQELNTQMRSVGEVMAIGRNFQESLQKALQSLELEISGLCKQTDCILEFTLEKMQKPTENLIFMIADAIRNDCNLHTIHQITAVDMWFLSQIKELIDIEKEIAKLTLGKINDTMMKYLKSKGFSDIRLAMILNIEESEVRAYRHQLKVRPVYKRVDSCASEFDTLTAYMYSTYDLTCESFPTKNKKIIILGSGCNRIGQGIEFDFSCTHAAIALKEQGFEIIMINSNPETVSTDYDVSDRLYFEPLTFEHVIEIINIENPFGVILQFGGQTPLKLAEELYKAGVNILGSSNKSINITENRILFQKFIKHLQIDCFYNAVFDSQKAIKQAVLHYPIIIRPSYVLGGNNMRVIYSEYELDKYLLDLTNITPILIEQFIENAIEIDVDCIFDGKDLLIGGIIEQIEDAGIHSGDSICSFPSFSIDQRITNKIIKYCRKTAERLDAKGFINIQFIVKDDRVYMLEINLRASRTIPFLTKATKLPLAKIAALCLAGISLKEQNLPLISKVSKVSIKMPIFPFAKFSYIDNFLGPEMKSTGEVMSMDSEFSRALLKAYLAAGYKISPASNILILQCPDQELVKIIKLVNKSFKNVFIINKLSLKLQQQKNLVYKIISDKKKLTNLVRNKDFDIIINISNISKLEIYGNELEHGMFIRQILHFNSMRKINKFFDAKLFVDKNNEVTSLQML